MLFHLMFLIYRYHKYLCNFNTVAEFRLPVHDSASYTFVYNAICYNNIYTCSSAFAVFGELLKSYNGVLDFTTR